jgi:alkylation response protein AidB-like acyl-CoA dehydrogenase
MRAEDDGDGFVLSGTKLHVNFASSADRLLVLARTGDGETDVDLFLVETAAPGVALSQRKNLGSETTYRVDFDRVRVPEEARIGAAGSGWATWNAVMHDGIVLVAAQAAGGAKAALEMTVEYAKTREQFGKPLGAFQSISHYLADAATAIEGGSTLVYEAAWSRGAGKDVSLLAPMAKLFMGEAFRDVTQHCQQVWGGVGFTIEYDIQLYFRRAKQLQISWWDDRTLGELIARQELD